MKPNPWEKLSTLRRKDGTGVLHVRHPNQNGIRSVCRPYQQNEMLEPVGTRLSLHTYRAGNTFCVRCSSSWRSHFHAWLYSEAENGREAIVAIVDEAFEKIRDVLPDIAERLRPHFESVTKANIESEQTS